jgi:hypothetical protein
MSLDIQPELYSQARAVDARPLANVVYERAERFLLAAASGLATITISAIWVALCLG